MRHVHSNERYSTLPLKLVVTTTADYVGWQRPRWWLLDHRCTASLCLGPWRHREPTRGLAIAAVQSLLVGGSSLVYGSHLLSASTVICTAGVGSCRQRQLVGHGRYWSYSCGNLMPSAHRVLLRFSHTLSRFFVCCRHFFSPRFRTSTTHVK